jgi:hypothetical protein
MITKTIDIQFTGQPVVSLLDSRLTKTASNDIQEYWASLQKSPKYAYLHVLAMTDSNHYGPNNNGDWFNEEDLKKYHNTFCSDAHIFLHHINKDPAKSVGRPIYSFYNDAMHRVELILAVEKNNPLAADTIGKIRRGEQLFVSMGCKVPYDICSICNHQARTRSEYCDHLKFDMKKIFPDGRQVYAINPPPLKFFDISIVSRPADRVAWALDKLAMSEPASAGSDVLLSNTADYSKLANAINKFSEILKTVDGEVVDYKDLDSGFANTLQRIRTMPDADFDLPEYTGHTTPGVLIRICISKGVAPTWGEIGRSVLGREASEHNIAGLLRSATSLLTPETLINITRDIISSDDRKPHPEIEAIIEKRAGFYKTAQMPMYKGPVEDPLAYHWYHNIPQVGMLLQQSSKYGSPAVTTPIIGQGDDGTMFKTTRYNVAVGKEANSLPHLARAALIAASIGVLLNGLTPVNMLTAGILTVGGLWFGDTKHVKVQVPLNGEVPAHTFFPKMAGNTGNIIAAAIPTMLALDYQYNKKIKHKDNPYYREEMHPVSKVIDRAGQFVWDHPFTAVGGALAVKGGIGAALAKEPIKEVVKEVAKHPPGYLRRTAYSVGNSVADAFYKIY